MKPAGSRATGLGKSFALLLRRVQGNLTLEEIARRAHLALPLLEQITSGQREPDEAQARQILTRGLEMEPEDVERALLGLRLYELGLRDNDVRQLIADEIRGVLPVRLRSRLFRVADEYARDREAGKPKR